MEISITLPDKHKCVGIETKDGQTYTFICEPLKQEKRQIGFLAYELEKPKKKRKQRKNENQR